MLHGQSIGVISMQFSSFYREKKVVKHIVFWKLKKKALGKRREENANLIKEKLEALNGRIPGLLSLEIGIDFSKSGNSADIALHSTFASREDFKTYLEHPEHTAVVPFIIRTTRELRVVDYEI
jgi:uncharacterized lipoprotein YehR (DUF1307 family)